MIQPVKYNAVNWVDGMKISQKHFIDQENFVIDAIRDSGSQQINSFNYGLLPIATGVTNKNIFEVYNTATSDVQLVINQCNAITPAGYRIALHDLTVNIKSLMHGMSSGENLKDGIYYILISVNPFDKVPFGDVDSEETPPRHPNTQAKHHIELLPESSVNHHHTSGNYLLIGRVMIQNNIAKADENFIPPCTSIHSHPTLLDRYNVFAKTMGNLQQYALKIIQKASFKNQNTVLANNVKALCTTLINHSATTYFQYRNIVPQLSPVYFVDLFARQALLLFNITQTLPAQELEEMLNYSFEWSDVSPHLLLSQLSAVGEINYSHSQCGSYMVYIKNLLISLETIFEKLSSLEYIGQKKENIIVNEQEVQKVSKEKRGWSILD